MAKKNISEKNLNKLITNALSIEDESAKDACVIGYMARSLIQATLPHSKKTEQEFSRTNGNFTLSIMAPKEYGLPYGSIPRLLVAWLTTEAIRTHEQTLVLGDSMADFMRQLDLGTRGGPRGDITRLKDQMMRLFSSSISCLYADQDRNGMKGFRIASEFCWFKPRKPGDPPVWNSTVTLSTDFFNEVITSSAPVDMRALSVLKQSPMALDIYCWITYRLSYLEKPTVIPWEALEMQFGSDYSRTRAFKEAFIGHLRAVCVIYPEARVEALDQGLKLNPSPPHVARLPKPG